MNLKNYFKIIMYLKQMYKSKNLNKILLKKNKKFKNKRLNKFNNHQKIMK